MKKMIALLLALALCLAVAGCTITKKEGSADKDATFSSVEESKPADTTEAAKAADAAAGSDKGDKQFADINAYISDPEVSKSIDSAKEGLGDVLTFDYHAEGDTLVYDYTYTKQYDDTAVATLRPALESSLEKNIDSFNQVVDVIKKNVNVSNPKLVINYHNNDGSIIATRTFS